MASTSDRPRSNSFAPLRTLLPFLRPYRGIAAAAIGALLVAAGAMLALPFALRRVIDVLAAKDAGTDNRIFAAFLAAGAVFAVFAALRFYLVTWLGERVVADLRAAVYCAGGADGSPVLRDHPGRRGAVASDHRHHAGAGDLGVNLSIILRSALNLIGALVLLTLTSASCRTHPGVDARVVVPLIVIGRRVRGLSRASQDRIADTSGLAGETLNAIQTVQAFTLEDLQSERYRKAVEESFADRRSPHQSARGADRGRYRDGIHRHHVRTVARRASSARGNPDRRPARPVHPVRRLRRQLRRGAVRDVGRSCSVPRAPWSV